MRYVYSAAVAAVLIIFSFIMFAQAPAPGLSITNYQIVNETFYSRKQSNVTYRADLKNTGSAQSSVTATVTSLVPSTQVNAAQNKLHFTSVPANGQVTSSDTFTILVDRTVPFDFNNLKWTFETPAPPPPIANAGPNQAGTVGRSVTLNGSASSNPSGIGTLTYSWAFTSRPGGSSAALSNPTTVTPSFVPDVAGNYVAALTVNNGAASATASTTVSTTAPPAPIAKAGPDQTVSLKATVVLNGAGSTSGSGNPLTYAWTLSSIPAGSSAALTGATTVAPTFVADQPGNYVAQLIVNDGLANSAASTVTVSTQTVKPVSNAGIGQVVNVNSPVQLNGAGSTDANGLPLTYKWSFTSLPQSSAAVLSSVSAVNPTFTADRPGTYIAQLIVNNGVFDGLPSTVTITTNPVLAPTANPGVNQTVQEGNLVQLNGTGSDPQNLPLTYQWSLINKPAGSSAVLSSAVIQKPTFTADQLGNYVAQLTVNNGYQSSAAATVTISTICAPPTANAGSNQSVTTGTAVKLDGSASGDLCRDPLTYSWSLTTQPAGSSATLSAANTVAPGLTPDVAGTYVAQLIVNNGFANSNPATVTITAANPDIMIPANLTVGVGLSTSFSVVLANPAPASGVFISFSSNDPSVTVTPQNIIVNQGNTSPVTQPKVNGIAFGSATITASASGLAPASSKVKVVAGTLAFTPPSLTITGVVTQNLTLAITPVSAASVTVNLTSSDPTIASVPATVTIPASASSVSVPVSGLKNGSVMVHASGANLADTTANVDVVIPSQISLPNNAPVALGQSVPYPVSLTSAAPANGVTIALTADPAKVTITPSSVFVAAGSTVPAAQPQITGLTPGSAAVSASAAGYTSASDTIQVNAAIGFTGGITIGTGASGNLTITLSGPAPAAGLVVNFVSGTPGVATVPATVTIPSGQTSTTAAVTGVSQGSSIITASGSNVANATATVTVSAGTITLPVNPTVGLGQAVDFPVALSAKAAADLTVALSSNDTSKVTVPASVMILKGQTSPATQPQITGAGAGSAIVTAAASGYTTNTQTVQVNAALAFAGPLTLNAGTSGNLILNLTGGQAPGGGLIVNLISDKTAFATVPQTVTIAAGQTSVSVPVQGVAVGSATITASSPNIANASAAVTVGTAPTIGLPSNPAVGLGLSTAFPITLSAPAAADVTIALATGDSTKVSIPASVVILKGATTPATQPQITGAGAGSATITASAAGYPNASVTVPITVAMALSGPLSIPANTSGNLTLTLTGGKAPANGLTINLKSNTSFATAATPVTIPAGQTTALIAVQGVAAGTATITASSPNIADATADVTVGAPLSIQVPASTAVVLGQSTAFAISLGAAAAADTTVTLTSADPSKASVTASVVILKGQTTPAAQPQVTGLGAGATSISAAATDYTSATGAVQINASLAFTGPLTVNAGDTGNLTLKLSGGVAPINGLSVFLSSDKTNFATVPPSVTIAAGQTSVSVPVTGVAPGSATITATSAGIASATAAVTVNPKPSIALQSGVTVQAGGTANLGVTLSAPALSAVTVTLSSSDPVKAGVSASVTIAAGQTTSSSPAVVSGFLGGSVTITASAPGYTSGTQTVQIASQTLAFAPATLTVNAPFPSNGSLTLTLSPAAQSNVTFALSSNSAAVTTGPSITLTAGQTSVAVPVTATAAGVATITASGSGMTATATVTANEVCGISINCLAVSGASIGKDLQSIVTVSTVGGPALADIAVTVTSGDPSKLLFSNGLAQAKVGIPAGTSSIGLLVQALDSTGSVRLTSSAANATGATGQVALTPSGFVLSGPNGIGQPFTTSVGNSAALTVSAARLDSSMNFAETQAVRNGLTVKVSVFGTPLSVGGVSPSPVTFTGGDVSVSTQFQAANTGSATLSALTPSGFSTPGQGANSVVATVIQASLMPSDATVGKGLETTANVRLSGPAPADMPLTVTSNDPSKLLLSATPNGVGSASITLQVRAGGAGTDDFYVYGLVPTGQATYTATAAGFNNGTGTVTFGPSGIILQGPGGLGATSFLTTIQNGDSALTVRSALLNSSSGFIATQNVAGPNAVSINVTSSNPATGTITVSPVSIAAGTSSAPTAFHPLATGTTNLSVNVPSGFTAPAQYTSISAQVVTQSISVTGDSGTPVTIGQNLQVPGFVTLPTPSGSSVTVTLTSNNPALLKLSTTATAAGSGTITVTIPAGSIYAQYYIQAFGNSGTGTATYTGSAPGYAIRTAAQITMAPSGVVISGPLGLGYFQHQPFPANIHLSLGPQPLTVSLGVVSPVDGTFMGVEQLAGGVALVVQLTNSNPSVGTLASNQATVQPGADSGTVQFTPLLSGSNTTVAVIQPGGFTAPTHGAGVLDAPPTSIVVNVGP